MKSTWKIINLLAHQQDLKFKKNSILYIATKDFFVEFLISNFAPNQSIQLIEIKSDWYGTRIVNF